MKKKIKDLNQEDILSICEVNESCCSCPLFCSIKCWGINKKIDFSKSEMEVEIDD